MTAIWINEKTGAVRVASDLNAAERFGNAGRSFDTHEALAAAGVISTKMLLDIFNKYAEAPVARFADRASAARRVFQAVLKNEPVVEEPVAPADGAKSPAPAPSAPATTPAAPKAKRGRKQGQGRFIGKHLWVKDGKNIRRPGSHGHKSLQVILDNPGIGVDEFVAAGGRLVDLRWDVDHGTVEAR